MTTEFTRRAEDLLEIIEQIKALTEQVGEYCTGECKRCPLKKECLGDALMDTGADYNIEKCADFINFFDTVQAEEEEAELDAQAEKEAIEAWEDANRWAGVDPAWANMGRYRR